MVCPSVCRKASHIDLNLFLPPIVLSLNLSCKLFQRSLAEKQEVNKLTKDKGSKDIRKE
jgi:hypothetical protein